MKEIFERINRTFENKVRLGIMSALAVNRTLDFSSMKKLLEVTDGNLSSNAAVLEESGYITIEKTIQGKKMHTSFVITADGLACFQDHLAALEELIARSRPD